MILLFLRFYFISYKRLLLLCSTEQQGFVCIFCYAENRCFAAVQPSATKLPPAAWILFSNPAAKPKKSPPKWVGIILAEQQGFEPWRHFHALRYFESRLFDQLEYCSMNCIIITTDYKKIKVFSPVRSPAAFCP